MPSVRQMRLAAIVSVVACALASNARAGVAFFDDTTDTIEVSGQTVFANAATYEAIVLFPSARSGGGGIVNEWQDFAEDKYFAVTPGPTGGLYGFGYGVSSGVFTGATAISLDEWHHVAFVYDGAEERLYLDGALLQSRPASGDVSDADSSVCHVGAIFRGAARVGFVGLIDVLRL